MRYDEAHRARKAMLLPNAYGQPCPRCGRVMLHDQVLELDHGDNPREGQYLGIVHRYCNRKAGGELGKSRLIAKKRADKERRYMPITRCALGIEISEDRLHTSIGLAAVRDDQEAVMLELVAYLDGTQSAPGEILGAIRELQPTGIVIDPHSQAATLIHLLEQEKVKGILKPNLSDVVVAHGRFLDELNAGRLRHVPHPRLDEAARAGVQRNRGGGQAWERRTATDCSPLTAVTLALWGLHVAPKPLPPIVAL